MLGTNAHFFTGADLVSDVDRRRRVVANAHRRQTWLSLELGYKLRHIERNLSLDPAGNCRAVQQLSASDWFRFIHERVCQLPRAQVRLHRIVAYLIDVNIRARRSENTRLSLEICSPVLRDLQFAALTILRCQ